MCDTYEDPYRCFKVDGEKSLAENIADNGGLALAEIAYEKWLSQQQSSGLSQLSPITGNFR